MAHPPDSGGQAMQLRPGPFGYPVNHSNPTAIPAPHATAAPALPQWPAAPVAAPVRTRGALCRSLRGQVPAGRFFFRAPAACSFRPIGGQRGAARRAVSARSAPNTGHGAQLRPAPPGAHSSAPASVRSAASAGAGQHAPPAPPRSAVSVASSAPWPASSAAAPVSAADRGQLRADRAQAAPARRRSSEARPRRRQVHGARGGHGGRRAGQR